MKKWLADEIKRRTAIDPKDPELVAILKARDAGRALEKRARAIAVKMKTAKGKAYKKLDDERDGVLDAASEAYFAYYNQLPEDRQEAIDKSLKINRHASPRVGQGYTISTGGDAIKGHEDNTWNFHWAGVVLTSDDKKDTVVLENYAVGVWAEENALWTFETYGTEKAGQSFHDRHAASDLHGGTPTTMTIRGDG
jgi:hypothetical protein